MAFVIIGGTLLTLAGLAACFLGLMFLIVSSVSSARLITGIILLATGAALLFFGIRLLRKWLVFSPAAIRSRILKAAAKRNGEITEETIIAEAGVKDAALQAAALLVSERRARAENRSGSTVYIFSEFQFELKFKKCPYCGNDYPVKGVVEKCPSCGGDLKITAKGTSDDDKFSMDIE